VLVAWIVKIVILAQLSVVNYHIYIKID